jgi:ADP-ribosylglycohydrolase
MMRAAQSLLGLSCGDAFGERFFVPREIARGLIAQRMLPPSPWPYTDDTAMAIAITEVLEGYGEIHQESLAANFGNRFLADPGRGYGLAMHTCAIVGGIVVLSAGIENIPQPWIEARESIPAWFAHPRP